MRRKDREVTDFDEIIDILSRCEVMHLAMVCDGKPYSVPLNFGFTVKDIGDTKHVELYFHGAKDGQKIRAIRENPDVCFSAVASAQAESLNEDKSIACDWTTFYESVVGCGSATILETVGEKEAALDALMLHNGYKMPEKMSKIPYKSAALASVAVVKISVVEITGKHHLKR